jgi:hypothetical protein
MFLIPCCWYVGYFLICGVASTPVFVPIGMSQLTGGVIFIYEYSVSTKSARGFEKLWRANKLS